MRLLASCVALLLVLAQPRAQAQEVYRGADGWGMIQALLQDPVTGNLLTIQAPGDQQRVIRHNHDGTWFAQAAQGAAFIQLARPGQQSPDLAGFGRVVITGEFEPNDPADPAAGGVWDLESLSITIRAVLTDAGGQRWSYEARIAARDGEWVRFVSTLQHL